MLRTRSGIPCTILTAQPTRAKLGIVLEECTHHADSCSKACSLRKVTVSNFLLFSFSFSVSHSRFSLSLSSFSSFSFIIFLHFLHFLHLFVSTRHAVAFSLRKGASFSLESAATAFVQDGFSKHTPALRHTKEILGHGW